MRFVLSFCLFLFAYSGLYSQNIDLMMQAWYWDYFQGGNFGNWVNTLNNQVPDLQAAGFKHIWLPPLPRTSTPNNQSNGYNPRDLYDFGEFTGADCAWGNRTELNTLISSLTAAGMDAVSDVVYNHRDGGKPERNPAVKTYITSSATSTPFPSDRFFCILPLGSNNPGNNGAGDYYIKIHSKAGANSGNCSNPYGAYQYKFYARTNQTNTYLGIVNETEPNGGADCNPDQANNSYALGSDFVGTLYEYSCCYTDELKITLNSSDFNAQDDTLFIYLNNYNSGYSDHYIYSIYSAPRNANIVNELEYWTYTDFTSMPSGQGNLNYNGFRPNDNTATTESLSGDWNSMLFFYDYDQNQTATVNELNAWTNWQLKAPAQGGVGIGGLRMDAVKHFNPAFLRQLLEYLNTQGTLPDMLVGEFFDTNAGSLKGWIDDVYNGMNASTANQVKVRIFDFALRQALKDACDQFGYDVRNVFNTGVVDGAGGSGFNTVTFINNHDYRSAGEPVQNDAMLAYAYILTNNQVGAPCVFYPDYYGITIPNAPVNNFESQINDVVALHQQYIYGSTENEYLSRFSTPYTQFFVQGQASTTLIYQIKPPTTGAPNVIVAINFAGTTLDVYQKIRTDWGASAGTTFWDALENSSTTTTNITPNQEIRVILPARSYTVYVQNTSLPAQLSELSARPTLARQVDVSWYAQQEVDLEKYELERSVGDNLHFEPIATVAAQGGNTARYYNHLDTKPLSGTKLYYRLKMVDYSGSYTYSNICETRLDVAGLKGEIFPNPAGNKTSLQLQSQQEQTVLIQALDLQGRSVWQTTADLANGNNLLEIPCADWQPGVYQLLIVGTTGQMNSRLVKK